jgi:Protein of unknown function (DUF3179).
MNVRQVVPRDAIPSVDDPTFGADYCGEMDDRVVVVESAEPVRAYPLRYLNFHEIVNDSVAGAAIAVTWCPICGSAAVYDRQIEGRRLTFGVSGKLADDDLVMYDHETDSEWKQSIGECIAGQLAGAELAVRPAPVLTWEGYRGGYPEGVVLQPPGGESEAASDDDSPALIEYERSPYAAYVDGEGFGVGALRGGESRLWARDDNIDPKTVILGVETDEAALGFPLSRVREVGGLVRTPVGDRAVLVVATETDGIHGFVDPGGMIRLTDGILIVDDTRIDPATGRGADGRRLERLPTRRLFAFTWQDDHGPESFYRPTAGRQY